MPLLTANASVNSQCLYLRPMPLSTADASYQQTVQKQIVQEQTVQEQTVQEQTVQDRQCRTDSAGPSTPNSQRRTANAGQPIQDSEC